jgi:hypothetical protein
LDQIEGMAIFVHRHQRRHFAPPGQSNVKDGWVAGVGDLEFLPVLLFCILCH